MADIDTTLYSTDPLLDRIQSIWEKLRTNPQEFASSFYSRVNKRLYSPFVNVNVANVCCILNSTGYAYNRSFTENNPMGYCPAQLEQIETVMPRSKFAFPYKAILPDGSVIYVLVRRFNKAYLKYDQQAIGSKFGPSNPTIDVCLPRLKGQTSFIRSDPFTNDFMIATMLYGADEQMGQHIMTYRDAAICSKEENKDQGNLLGIVMLEGRQLGGLSDLRSMDELNDLRSTINYTRKDGAILNLNALNINNCRGIINQLLYVYTELQERYAFRHNHSCAANIMISREKVQQVWRGVSIESDIKVKLVNFANSAISFPLGDDDHNIRFYTAGFVSKIIQKLAPFQPNTGKRGIDRYFKLGGLTVESMLSDVRHTGLPYYAAFDLYTVMMSIFLIPDFWMHVNSNDAFRAAYWEPLWFLDEQDTMRQRINNALRSKMRPTYYNIIRLLSGVHLICTLPTKLLKQIQIVSF